MATATIDTSALLAYGETQVGKPYVFGTAGPNTFDCSGLIQYMLKHFGVTVPHHAADQAALGSAVAADHITEGDLVFSDWGDGPNSHVGIATDSGHILVAPHTGTTVAIQPLTANYRSKITAVRRLPQLTGVGTPDGQQLVKAPGNTGATAGSAAPLPWINQITGDIGRTTAGLWDDLSKPITGGIGDVAEGLQAVGKAFVTIAIPFQALGWLLNPNHAMRAGAFVIGAAMIGGGLVLLIKEMRA